MTQNSIGNYFFINYDRPPGAPKQHVIDKARPGVTGKAFWRQGTWGDPDVVRTRVDAPNVLIALQEMARYRALIGQNPVILVYAGVPSTALGFNVVVKDVRLVEASSRLIAVGGLNPPGLGFLVAEWTLVPVAIT
jgi:hypothetical protein